MASIKILIADDNAPLQRVLKRVFEQEGYIVLQLLDGVDLIAQAIAAKPDVIVLDVGLPDADGRDLLCSLKREPLTAMIPVVVWSGQDAESQRRIALDLGAEDFVEKGTAHELLSKIERLLWRLHPDDIAPARSA